MVYVTSVSTQNWVNECGDLSPIETIAYLLEARITSCLPTNRDPGAVGSHRLGYDIEGEKFLSQIPERIA